LTGVKGPSFGILTVNEGKNLITKLDYGVVRTFTTSLSLPSWEGESRNFMRD